MIEIGIAAVLAIIGYIFGTAREKRHYEDIREREKKFLNIAVRMDDGGDNLQGQTVMVTSSVVIASDYFKNLVASLKTIIGGRLSSHESLMDRSRREAILRLKEKAHRLGASEIVAVRLETSFLDQIGIEIFAYGTAIRK